MKNRIILGIGLTTIVCAVAAIAHLSGKSQPREGSTAVAADPKSSGSSLRPESGKSSTSELARLRACYGQARQNVMTAEENYLRVRTALEAEEARFEYQQNYAANNPGAALGVEVDLTPTPPNPALEVLLDRRARELQTAKAAFESVRQQLVAAETAQKVK